MSEPRTPAEAYRSACIRLHGALEHYRVDGLGSATAEEVLDKLFRRSAEVEQLFLAMRAPTLPNHDRNPRTEE